VETVPTPRQPAGPIRTDHLDEDAADAAAADKSWNEPGDSISLAELIDLIAGGRGARSGRCPVSPLTAQVAALQKQVDDLQASLARWESRAADWEAVFAAIGRKERAPGPVASRPQLLLVQGGAR